MAINRAATILGFTESSIRRMIHAGKLHKVEYHHMTFVTADSVMAFMENRENVHGKQTDASYCGAGIPA